MGDVLRHLPCGYIVGWSIFAKYRSFLLLSPIEACSNYGVLLSDDARLTDSSTIEFQARTWG